MNEFIQGANNVQKNQRVPKTRRTLNNNRSYQPPNYHSNKYQGQRNGNINRAPRQITQNHYSDQTAMLSNTTSEAIVSIVKTIATNQELIMELQKKRLNAEERKADALENIAQGLRSLFITFEQEKNTINSDESSRKNNIISGDDILQCNDKAQDYSKNISQHTKEQPGTIDKINTIKSEGQCKKNYDNMTKDVKTKKRTALKTSSDHQGILSREDAMKMIENMREQGSTFTQIAQHLIEINQPTFSGKGRWHAQTIHRLLQKQKQLKAA